MISGDYQYRAITSGSSPQRFWHHSKKCAITHFLPPSQEDMVLDVGCGSGVIASFLSEFGASVIGLDANEEAIALPSSHDLTNSDELFYLRLLSIEQIRVAE